MPEETVKGGRPKNASEKYVTEAIAGLRAEFAVTPAGAIDPNRRALASALIGASIQHNGGIDLVFIQGMRSQFEPLLREFEAMLVPGETQTLDQMLKVATKERDDNLAELKKTRRLLADEREEVRALRTRVADAGLADDLQPAVRAAS